MVQVPTITNQENVRPSIVVTRVVLIDRNQQNQEERRRIDRGMFCAGMSSIPARLPCLGFANRRLAFAL